MEEKAVETTELVAWLTELAQKAQEFAFDQAPAIAQEMVLRGRIMNTFWCLFGAVILAVSALSFKELVKAANRSDEDTQIAMAIIGGIALIVGFFSFGLSLEPTFTAWFTPKLFILEEVMGMVE